MKSFPDNDRNTMMVEIRGVGFINKGAELMLYAILQKLGESCKNVNFVMSPSSRDYQYLKRARLGLYQKIWLRRYKIQWGNLLSCFIPEKAKKMYGLVTDSEIDIVLDASGFAYSDHFKAGATEEMAGCVSKWKRNDKKIVLLPQAFGPFETFRVKRAFKVIAQKADLIFARDKISYQYISDIVGSLPNIFMAPDFTNLLEGKVPDYFSADKYKVCIVPNCRMIDKVPKEKGETYLPFLIKCCNYLLEREAKPFILIHEGDKDFELARKIRDNTDNKIEIIRESDPLYIKGILGNCESVISSRFHGLVSALSQGVPSVATSWSHKYQMLFDDYNCGECMISSEAGDKEIKEKIDLIMDQTSRSLLKNKIKKAAEIQKKRTDEMWDRVLKVFPSGHIYK